MPDAGARERGGVVPLTVRVDRNGPVTTLRLSGELDLANADTVRRVAARLADEHAADVQVYAADLMFLDAAGLGALVHLQQLVSRAGGHVSVHGLRPFQRRVVSIAQLEQVLDVD